MNEISDMERYLLFTFSVITFFVMIPVLVRLGQSRAAWWTRLYVAIFGASAMASAFCMASGNRPFGYTPELIVAGCVAIGFVTALHLLYKDRDGYQPGRISRPLF